MNGLDWQDDAACRGRWALFDGIPPDENPRNRLHPRHQAALALCRECPVLADCRQWALTDYWDDTAVVGGMTGRQRRQRRQMAGLMRPAPPRTLHCGHGVRLGHCTPCNERRRVNA